MPCSSFYLNYDGSLEGRYLNVPTRLSWNSNVLTCNVHAALDSCVWEIHYQFKVRWMLLLNQQSGFNVMVTLGVPLRCALFLLASQLFWKLRAVKSERSQTVKALSKENLRWIMNLNGEWNEAQFCSWGLSLPSGVISSPAHQIGDR